MPVLERGHDLPEIPEGWVPDGSVILGIAKHQVQDDVWEAILPHYSIVGRGRTLGEASEQAIELAEDYFRMCAADGLSFADARRSMPAGWFARELAGALAGSLRHRVRHTAARTRIIRLPAEPLAC